MGPRSRRVDARDLACDGFRFPSTYHSVSMAHTHVAHRRSKDIAIESIRRASRLDLTVIDQREATMQCCYRTVSLLSLVLMVVGCGNPAPSGPDAREQTAKLQGEKPASKQLAGGYDAGVMAKRINESMSQLSPEDRKAAEAQKFCPVGVTFDDKGKPVRGLLGSVGKPVKMLIKDQPVFIMCPSCTKEFEESTDKYLAVLGKIRASQENEQK